MALTDFRVRTANAKDEAYVEYTERRLNGDILSRIGDRPIDEIQAPEIVSMACAIEARGASDVARRAIQTASQIFRFGIAHGMAQQNPATMFLLAMFSRRCGPRTSPG